jgi:hypothetical protein
VSGVQLCCCHDALIYTTRLSSHILHSLAALLAGKHRSWSTALLGDGDSAPGPLSSGSTGDTCARRPRRKAGTPGAPADPAAGQQHCHTSTGKIGSVYQAHTRACCWAVHDGPSPHHKHVHQWRCSSLRWWTLACNGIVKLICWTGQWLCIPNIVCQAGSK